MMNKTECAIYDLFKELGVPAHLDGCKYLTEAVKCACDGTYEGTCATKPGGVYCDIAEKFGKSRDQVERSMRHAIEAAFDSSNTTQRYQVFGNSIDPSKGKPTNIMFVFQCANEIERRMSA